ncbi:hypothetical protein KBI52_12275 [Microvirga sp. HBU67558]|uniref:hypothetical protein n=1 Tax=Microvirga sp. HBU67558 TaxID=2824562 RepID=UPI001B38DB8D|nr:hypothetical protein [Microvirga sp. HBU67558]MBQ0820983.1 hypothetical protein [Microvirga sp. HBU67558]
MKGFGLEIRGTAERMLKKQMPGRDGHPVPGKLKLNVRKEQSYPPTTVTTRPSGDDQMHTILTNVALQIETDLYMHYADSLTDGLSFESAKNDRCISESASLLVRRENAFISLE